MALSTQICTLHHWSLATRWATSKHIVMLCLFFLISTSTTSYGQDSVTTDATTTEISQSTTMESSQSTTMSPLTTQSTTTEQTSNIPNNTTVAPLKMSSSRNNEICRRQKEKVLISHEGCEDVEIEIIGCGGFCYSETIVQASTPSTKSSCRCCTAHVFEVAPRTIKFPNCTFVSEEPPETTIYIGRRLRCACQDCNAQLGEAS